jgi:Tat protein translocase TatB subunit
LGEAKMIYLFILESIGTSELILIGLVALIVFGPRKLPELARMLGKAMNEFRRSTDEFKRTWEKEVDFENEVISKTNSSQSAEAVIPYEKSIQSNSISLKNEIVAPEIKEIKSFDLEENLTKETSAAAGIINSESNKNNQPSKQDWL